MSNHKKIILPSGKEALAIEIKDLNELNEDFISSLNLATVDRYICFWMKFEREKVFVMAVKDELKKPIVLRDLVAELSYKMTNIVVLNQL